MLRIWRSKVPVDENFRRWGLLGPLMCCCCISPSQETISHVFHKAPISNRTWSYFSIFAGINMEGMSFRELNLSWWNIESRRVKGYYQAIPSIIVYELWKMRNNIKHEGKGLTLHKVIFNVTKNIGLLLRVKHPNQKYSSSWPRIINELKLKKAKLKITKVVWQFPQDRWVKYNTDRASRGNPGTSSYAFCLRNGQGDKGARNADANNVEDEIIAILQATIHCSTTNHNKVVMQIDFLFVQKY